MRASTVPRFLGQFITPNIFALGSSTLTFTSTTIHTITNVHTETVEATTTVDGFPPPRPRPFIGPAKRPPSFPPLPPHPAFSLIRRDHPLHQTSISASQVSSTGSSASAVSGSRSGSSSKLKRLSTGAVFGIVIAVVVVVVISLTFALKLRRRRLRRRANQTHRPESTISPFKLLTAQSAVSATFPVEFDARGISTRTIVRQQLETELLATQEKMVDLEETERSRITGSSMPPQNNSPRGSLDLGTQLQAAREHIDMLITRINTLEANTDSAWALRISGEPPPEYV
ncbi:hypothetical protein B0H19DRAFT_1067656 [Mycena capillaripes]|nr:hypothetical protein B0H19DRAFT_1067656 [Mycena capillaripes]